jgi:hypothetical protein
MYPRSLTVCATSSTGRVGRRSLACKLRHDGLIMKCCAGLMQWPIFSDVSNEQVASVHRVMPWDKALGF